jgi:hypothetical protein
LPRTAEVNNREDEDKLFEEFKALKSAAQKEIDYVAINMENLKLSDSSLLRFLAHLTKNYSQSIILYDLDFELFDELINNNKYFLVNFKDLEGKIPFWYTDKGILIYSKIKEHNFHFADILYGKDENEFQALNYIVSHTFPNTVSITNENEIIKNYKIPDYLPEFFHQSALRPFDLLLIDENNKPLFLSNLEIRLSQEMIIEKEITAND